MKIEKTVLAVVGTTALIVLALDLGGLIDLAGLLPDFGRALFCLRIFFAILATIVVSLLICAFFCGPEDFQCERRCRIVHRLILTIAFIWIVICALS